jgi:hypothetical protein
LVRFLRQAPELHGFVIPKLPTLFGQVAVSCLHRNERTGVAVFQLSADTCCKVGRFVDIDVEVLRLFEHSVVPVFPRIFKSGPTGNVSYPVGFCVELCDDVLFRVLGAAPLSVETVVGSVFWALYVLHAEGIVHNDVKPANILVTRSGQVVLCDAGRVFHMGDAGGAFIDDDLPRSRGCTEAFSATLLFAALSDSDVRYWDAEGLFWTTLYLRACVRKGRAGLGWGEERFTAFCNLDETPLSVMGKYLTQAKARVLVHPVTHADTMMAFNRQDDWAVFYVAARAYEAAQLSFPCPEPILKQLFESKNKS